MDREQIENSLKILKHYNDLFIISDEFLNRIPEKHHEKINDLITEIENIAKLLMVLESDIYYYEYLKQ